VLFIRTYYVLYCCNKTANINVKNLSFKTQCKGDIHSSKTAHIILPGLMTEYRWTPLCVQAKQYSNYVTRFVSTSIHGCIWTWIRFCTRNGDVQSRQTEVWSLCTPLFNQFIHNVLLTLSVSELSAGVILAGWGHLNCYCSIS